jgi:hypothetical protein
MCPPSLGFHASEVSGLEMGFCHENSPLFLLQNRFSFWGRSSQIAVQEGVLCDIFMLRGECALVSADPGMASDRTKIHAPATVRAKHPEGIDLLVQ